MRAELAADQLETLGRLLRADGWGIHYLKAVQMGEKALREMVAASPDSGREADRAL
jgi:hypothetical protein